MTKLDIARMLGVSQAQEVPANATLAETEAYYRELARRASPILRTDPDPLPPGERVMRAKPFDLMHEVRVRVARLYDEYCSIMRSEFDFPGRPWTPERDNDTAAMDVAELLVMLADPQLEQPALNRDATVAVSPTYTYNEDMSQAPRGVKLILLGQGGVAQLGEYNGDPFWIGWAALPRRAQG